MKLFTYFITLTFLISCMSKKNHTIELEQQSDSSPKTAVAEESSNHVSLMIYDAYPKFEDSEMTASELRSYCMELLNSPFPERENSEWIAQMDVDTEQKQYTKDDFQSLNLRAQVVAHERVSTGFDVLTVSAIEEQSVRYECHIDGTLKKKELLAAKDIYVHLSRNNNSDELAIVAEEEVEGLIVNMLSELNPDLSLLKEGQEWSLRQVKVNGFAQDAISTYSSNNSNLRRIGFTFDSTYLEDFQELVVRPEQDNFNYTVFSIDYDVVLIEDNKVIRKSDIKRVYILNPYVTGRPAWGTI